MSRSSRSCLIAALAVAAAAPSAAQAQQPAPARTVEAQGVASVKVTPRDRQRESSIRAAVEAAEDKALPLAVAEAREYAAKLAQLAGLTLGEIVSIGQTPSVPYGPFFGPAGTFGPGRFCGTIRRPVFERGADGRRRRVGTRARRTCRVPPFAAASVTVTFAAQ
jgi:uncharacterized protein DUF541